MNKREDFWLRVGSASAIAVSGVLSLFAWLFVSLLWDVDISLPNALKILWFLTCLIASVAFIPATGAAMGLIAAYFWQRTAAPKIALNSRCYWACLVAYAWGFLPFGLGWLWTFFLVYAFLVSGMWWGLDMGLKWFPTQPWRYLAGETPDPPKNPDHEFDF